MKIKGQLAQSERTEPLALVSFGGVPEQVNGPDCKSEAPRVRARGRRFESAPLHKFDNCPVGSSSYQQGHPQGVSQEDEVVRPIVILNLHLAESQGQNDVPQLRSSDRESWKI